MPSKRPLSYHHKLLQEGLSSRIQIIYKEFADFYFCNLHLFHHFVFSFAEATKCVSLVVVWWHTRSGGARSRRGCGRWGGRWRWLVVTAPWWQDGALPQPHQGVAGEVPQQAARTVVAPWRCEEGVDLGRRGVWLGRDRFGHHGRWFEGRGGTDGSRPMILNLVHFITDIIFH